MNSLVQIRTGEASAELAHEKERLLFGRLGSWPSLIVALSGGIDSAYLSWAAHQSLGEHSLSITAISASYSAFDREQVEIFLRAAKVRHEFVETHELENPAYRVNDPNRCYYCKDELFAVLDQLAAQRGIAAIAYGVCRRSLRFSPWPACRRRTWHPDAATRCALAQGRNSFPGAASQHTDVGSPRLRLPFFATPIWHRSHTGTPHPHRTW